MIYPVSIFTLDHYLQRSGCVSSHIGFDYTWERGRMSARTPVNQNKIMYERGVAIVLDALGFSKEDFEFYAMSADNAKT